MYIGDYELESPLMNAGGLVKTVEDVRLMAATGVGAVLGGSFTLDPRIGNSPNGECVYYHDPATRITYNALGMPNKGLDIIASQLPTMISIAHDQGKPFILNFAPVSSDPAEEVNRLSEVLLPAGLDTLDGLELNGSCPNVVTAEGGRHELLSHNPQRLGEVASELSDIRTNELYIGSLIVRISPFNAAEDAVEIVQVLDDASVDYIAGFNTFPGGKPRKPKGEPWLEVAGGVGGQSGPGMNMVAELQMNWLMDAHAKTKAQLEVIGSNGIYDAASMKRRLDMGAKAVSATTLFWEADDWGHAVTEVLDEYGELVA